jgi:hypothetical protein
MQTRTNAVAAAAKHKKEADERRRRAKARANARVHPEEYEVKSAEEFIEAADASLDSAGENPGGFIATDVKYQPYLALLQTQIKNDDTHAFACPCHCLFSDLLRPYWVHPKRVFSLQ